MKLRLWPPFLGMGIRVLELSDDWTFARVRMKRHFWNANYVGTHFGGALFAMTDPFWMLLLLHVMGREYVVWDKAGEIEFVAATREPVYAEFRIDPAVVDEIKGAVAGGDKHLRWFETEVKTNAGELIARVRKQLYFRKKRRPTAP
jgi:acyl-coenzyme A thioesterase PaaI-like protein